MYLIMLVMIPQIHLYAGLNWFEHDTFLNRPSSESEDNPSQLLLSRGYTISFLLIFSFLVHC